MSEPSAAASPSASPHRPPSAAGKQAKHKAKDKAKDKDKKRKHKSSSSSRRSRKRSSSSRRERSPGERLAGGLKLLRYAAEGDARKVARLVTKCPEVDLAVRDSRGDTLLHKACIAGGLPLVQFLLAAGCRADVANAQGSTPAHLAGLHRHTPCLLACLRSAQPPDIDAANAQGVTVRHLVDRLLTAAPAHTAAAGAYAAAAAAAAAEEAEEEEEEAVGWEERLAQENSDPEGDGGLLWGSYADGAAPGAPGHAAVGEEDDAWADRLFHEMRQKERHRRAQAFSSWQTLHEERARKQQAQAAATAEAQRILREEAARDAAWRRGVLTAASASAAAVDIGAHCAQLEAKWLALDGGGGGGGGGAAASIAYDDVPWLVALDDVPGGGARMVGPRLPEAAEVGGPQRARVQLEAFAEVALHGVAGAAAVKQRLRGLLLRWHPDKFVARYGARLAAGERERILGGVAEMSRLTTELMQGGLAA